MNNLVDHYINNFDPVTDMKKKRPRNPDAKLTDKLVRHCRGCGMCWEYDRGYCRSSGARLRGTISVRWMKNFPTYGKQKELCPSCKPGNTIPLFGDK
tara:strand:- start:796 stop:1086 length:291 start_codon:yes stop_codon:yes gene_type:complete